MLKIKKQFLFRTTLLGLFFMFFFINNVFASVAGIDKLVFTAIPNSFIQGEISKVISVKAQNSSGDPQVFDDSDGLLELSTNSPTGNFYSNNTSATPINTLKINNKTYSGRNFYYKDTSSGDFIITVRLSLDPDSGKSWTATQNITISDSPGGGGTSTSTLTSINITTLPNKINYMIGDSLDISGMVVTGTYSDSSTLVEPISLSNISGFNSSTSTTDQILTILYNDKTTTFLVNIYSVLPPVVITKVVNHYSVHYVSEDLSDYVEEESLKISAGRERIAYVGTPLIFTAKNNKTDKNIDFSWSFGDLTEGKGSEITHTYKKAGEYIVVLNGEYNNSKAVSRTIVKVFDPKVAISFVSDNLEIKNDGENEINIGGWKIKNLNGAFTIPNDTIIGSKNNIIISLKDIPLSFPSDNSVIIEDQSLNTIASAKLASNNLALSEEEINKVVLKNNEEIEKILGIKISDAEKMVLNYKTKVSSGGLKSEVKVVSESNFVGRENNKKKDNIEEIKQIATVQESINSTSSIGFWEKVINFPINSIKNIGSMFYDL